jgi:hypothetical protein
MVSRWGWCCVARTSRPPERSLIANECPALRKLIVPGVLGSPDGARAQHDDGHDKFGEAGAPVVSGFALGIPEVIVNSENRAAIEDAPALDKDLAHLRGSSICSPRTRAGCPLETFEPAILLHDVAVISSDEDGATCQSCLLQERL